MQNENRSAAGVFAAMSEGTLDPAGFTHRDHVICAAFALRGYDFFEAAFLYANGLKALVKKAGVPEKFNATVTFAFLSIIAQKLAESPGVSADDLPEHCPELMQKTLLSPWYTGAVLASDQARQFPVMPQMKSA
ncbi:hypothetical protein [Halocynthiibacter styelae]|uniref:Uncharacterized protein n=1 Tax=Halocynthiibacter styelae TaxID=2761955 RepID=A0A8J7LL07_9RHOB|nr:hypothetical protein [Paenihalocynthiibacter styelae]MBI1493734.1 hypothetical protein [Paenihalocynthiibacter styelae]